MQVNGSTKKHRMKISGLTFPQLKKWVTVDLGMKPFRAQQLFSWIHLRRVTSFHQMTDISLAARNRLEQVCEITDLESCNTISANDGTVKNSFILEDGEVIESVLIPDHVPHVAGDTPWGHRSRAYAIGYMKALLDVVNKLH